MAVLCAAAFVRLHAQEAAGSADAPAVRALGTATAMNAGGLDAAITVAGAHDSAIGWYTAVVPMVSYRFSPRYSADVSVPVYPYRLSSNVDSATFQGGGFPGVPSSQDSGLRYQGVDAGDALLRVHRVVGMGGLQSVSTASMTLPTGNRSDGLGAGRVTFNVDNMVTRYVRGTGLFADAGAGDSSGMTNRQVTEDAGSLGPQAQFAAGVATNLPLGWTIESYAYEQLPLGDQKTYTTLRQSRYSSVTVPTGRSVYEDNGFNTSLYVPVSDHMTLSGAYNRSLRLHLDTVSVGVTYVWRGTGRHRMSMIERAMREAESGSGEIPYPAEK